jgi:hypothetical protein
VCVYIYIYRIFRDVMAKLLFQMLKKIVAE